MIKKDKKQRQFDAIIPGCPMGADARETDLNFAIRKMKKSLKESGKINILYDKTAFAKKSDVRRNEVDIARYKQQKAIKKI